MSNLDDEVKKSPSKSTPKKVKVEAYKLTKEQKSLIKDDELNKKLWDEAMQSLNLGPVCTMLNSCRTFLMSIEIC